MRTNIPGTSSRSLDRTARRSDIYLLAWFDRMPDAHVITVRGPRPVPAGQEKRAVVAKITVPVDHFLVRPGRQILLMVCLRNPGFILVRGPQAHPGRLRKSVTQDKDTAAHCFQDRHHFVGFGIVEV